MQEALRHDLWKQEGPSVPKTREMVPPAPRKETQNGALERKILQ